MNILAIGAHPDDIEFGCAHVLIQEVRRGNRAKLLVLSRGEAASHGTPASREAEARAAAVLVQAEIEFLDFGGDCHIEPTPANAFAIATRIRKFQPSIVLAPHTGDNQHPDHAVVGKLTRDACRFARYAGLEDLKDHAAHAIAALYYYTITQPLSDPDIVIDVGDVVTEWEATMRCHASQMQTRSYADLRLAAARHLGLSIGVEYAAGFYANDPVRVAALSEIALSSRHFSNSLQL
ncbi:MAG TPA: PIG-L family deacetylase [Bryobacteraceae bacterium]|nr:PIG-L family deacetylase [Bryobacteraceae bacterium]